MTRQWTPLRRALVVAWMMARVATPLTSRAGDEAPGAARAEYDSPNSAALDGLIAGRAELHSGTCRVVWERNGWATVHYDVIFDFDAENLRFDLRVDEANRKIQEIRTPHERVLHVAGSKVIARQPPSEKISVADAVPLDPRVAGFITLAEFNSGSTWRTTSDHLRNDLPERAVSNDAAGLLRIECANNRTIEVPFLNSETNIQETVTRHQSYRRVIWVDPQKGFAPVRLEVWNGYGDDLEKARNNSVRRALTETSWRQIDETWLPTRCVMRDVASPARQGDSTTTQGELTFEWQSINIPVDSAAFTPEGLGADVGTFVTNTRLGPSVIESYIGDAPADGPNEIGAPTSNVALIVAAVLAVLFVVVVFLLRSARKQPQPKS
ncbi:MAG TPA: hypothetical protein VND64_02695 [Pirellulales bacterium]|nr:hypothetical protein [Pirellulales bacterium]